MVTKRIRGLDGLRGVAILLVMLFHYVNPSGLGVFGRFCSVGWIGVDLFFVLSGFLITGILFDVQNEQGYLRNFYIRRVLRLFPAYFVFIGVTLLLAQGPGVYPWHVTAPFLFYGANLVYLFEPNFQSVGPVTVIHLWSLALEEQFYLVWPWLLALAATRERILKMCVVGMIGSLALRLMLANAHLPPAALYAELPTRADSLLIGAAIAMMVRDPRFDLRGNIQHVRAAGLIAALAFLWMGHQSGFSFKMDPVKTWGFSYVAVAAGAAVLLAKTEGTWTNQLCATRLLRFFGKYSYGIYLFHFAPAQQFLRFLTWLHHSIHQQGLASIIGFLVILAVVTSAAMLSFHLIEKPFLQLKKRFEQQSAATETPSATDLAAEAAGS